MSLLVQYKCEQTLTRIYSIEHKIYQAYKDIGNVSMQDINTSERDRERERAIANTGDLFRGSSTLALRLCLQHYEGFLLKTIPPDHSVPQHLQGVHTRTLGLTSPLTCSRKNKHTQAHQLAEAAPLHRAPTRTRNNKNPQVRLLKYKMNTLVISTL